MKLFLIIFFSLLIHYQLQSQQQALVTQYKEIMPLFNPGYSGVEKYSEFNFGFRQQWSGMVNAPTITYASFSGFPTIKSNNKKKPEKEKLVKIPDNGLRMSNPFLHKKFLRDSSRSSFRKLITKAKTKLKKHLKAQKENTSRHGLSGVVVSESRGPFKTFAFSMGYSYHIQLDNEVRLSTGLSGILANTAFDSEKAMVSDPENDVVYQQYLNGLINKNAYFINAGFLLYSDKFYVSYAFNNVVSEGLGSELNFSGNMVEKYHNVAGGLNFTLSPQLDLSPGFIYFFKNISPRVYMVNTKVIYQQKYWLGFNYRNDKSLGISTGFIFNGKYKLSYTYDNPSPEFDGINKGTHEIVFGISLGKTSFTSSYIN